MKKLLSGVLMIGIVAGVAILASSAFFSDTETSAGNAFLAGSLDLLVNGLNDPTTIIDVSDLKPGDGVYEEKELTIQNPTYVWMHIKDLIDEQGEQTEPEKFEEGQSGAQSNIQDYLTYDLSVRRNGVDDEALIAFEHRNLLPEMVSCWIPLGKFNSGTTIVTQSFHFGEGVTNWAQGDKLTFTEEFYAEQIRNNPNPIPPQRDRIWDESSKKCIDSDCIQPPSGLISWWSGDGNPNDVAGGNEGVLNNGAGFSTGKVDQAFDFDGIDDFVQIPTLGLPIGNNNRTLELWVKIDSFLSDVPDPHSPLEAFFAGYGNFGSSNETYALGTAGNVLYFSQWGNAIFGPSLQTGQWYHVAVTNEGNSVTLYLNGSPVAAGSLQISTPTDTQFYIGRIPGSLGDIRRLDGRVDEVEVYNRALGSSEIQDIYETDSSGKCKSPIVFSDNFRDGNTDGWWLGYSLASPSNNGNWRVERGELLQDTGYDGVIALIENFQFSDQTIETKVKLNGPSGGGGLILWYQDNNNWTHAIIYPAAGFVEVSAHVNGTTFGFQYPYPSLANDTWYDLKVVADSTGGNLDVYLDGNYLFTHTVTTPNRTGQSGAMNGNAGGAFDDFKLTSN